MATARAVLVRAIMVGLAAVGFAQAADYAFSLFKTIVALNPYWPFLLTPAIFALLAWATQGFLKPTRGSGISTGNRCLASGWRAVPARLAFLARRTWKNGFDPDGTGRWSLDWP